MFIQIVAIAALVASAQSQCTLTHVSPIPPAASSCLYIGHTTPCATPCAQDFVGTQFGTLTSYSCTLTTGYTYNCQCIFSSKTYTTSCPSAHTNTNPCVDLVPAAFTGWCTAMCSSSAISSAALTKICYNTCTCSGKK